jgi:regulation of enolase protein 1 (concanavalin A-like superfamily)
MNSPETRAVSTMNTFLTGSSWHNPPLSQNIQGEHLRLKSKAGSDFWQRTLYGFSRDSGHALLAPIPAEGSLEVDFHGNFTQLYDQAGLMLRTDDGHWIKAGVEVSDSRLHLASVVTNGRSDWAMGEAPWLHQSGTVISIRASWSGNAVTVRALNRSVNCWETMRVAPFEVHPEKSQAGLFVCSPEAEGLEVVFTRIALVKPIKDFTPNLCDSNQPCRLSTIHIACNRVTSGTCLAF